MLGTIMPILGGIITATEELAIIKPRVKLLSYPAFVIGGSIKTAIAITVAGAEPLTAARNIQERTTVKANPPDK